MRRGRVAHAPPARVVVRAFARAAAGRVPVLAGVMLPATGPATEAARQAAAEGADAVVVGSPYYFGVDGTAQRRHIETVIEAAGRPALLYNIPQCTNQVLAPALVGDLARDSRVLGIKDSAGDFVAFQAFLAVKATRADFRVLQGHEHLVAASLRLGGTAWCPGSPTSRPGSWSTSGPRRRGATQRPARGSRRRSWTLRDPRDRALAARAQGGVRDDRDRQRCARAAARARDRGGAPRHRCGARAAGVGPRAPSGPRGARRRASAPERAAMQPGAEPRWNAPFVGIPSFLRSVIATDLDRLDADIAVMGVPSDEGSRSCPAPGSARAASESTRCASAVGEGLLRSRPPPGVPRARDRQRPDRGRGGRGRPAHQRGGDFDNVTVMVRQLLDRGALPVVLGGDHGVTYPVVRAYREPLHVVHFDAHLDYLPFVHGLELTNSHPFRHIARMAHVRSLSQIGIRSLRNSQVMMDDSLGDGNRIVTWRSSGTSPPGASSIASPATPLAT